MEPVRLNIFSRAKTVSKRVLGVLIPVIITMHSTLLQLSKTLITS